MRHGWPYGLNQGAAPKLELRDVRLEQEGHTWNAGWLGVTGEICTARIAGRSSLKGPCFAATAAAVWMLVRLSLRVRFHLGLRARRRLRPMGAPRTRAKCPKRRLTDTRPLSLLSGRMTFRGSRRRKRVRNLSLWTAGRRSLGRPKRIPLTTAESPAVHHSLRS